MNDFLDRRKALSLGIAALVSAAIAFVARDALRPPAVRAPAPAAPEKTAVLPAGPLVVRDRQGAARDLAVKSGRGLILHFWATWCGPCREEMPGLVKFVKETKGDPNVEFLAVSVDEDWKVVDAWLKERGIADLPLALDPKGDTARRVGTKLFPETWFVAPSGRIFHYIDGPADWNDPRLRALAAEFSRASAARS
ncbi:MAG TPA: TlpA disulfide reductase family protein [Thermoanaerobaculia bacterium]|nr:TlpA disulfide reductase family protein [Thermoanaerobaculia bacterium]